MERSLTSVSTVEMVNRVTLSDAAGSCGAGSTLSSSRDFLNRLNKPEVISREAAPMADPAMEPPTPPPTASAASRESTASAAELAEPAAASYPASAASLQMSSMTMGCPEPVVQSCPPISSDITDLTG